jgi:hypothetical protein
MDNAVDRLDEAIKLYVTKTTRESLDEGDGRRAMEIISFTINLEHIGDTSVASPSPLLAYDRAPRADPPGRWLRRRGAWPHGKSEALARNNRAAASFARARGATVDLSVTPQKLVKIFLCQAIGVCSMEVPAMERAPHGSAK